MDNEGSAEKQVEKYRILAEQFSIVTDMLTGHIKDAEGVFCNILEKIVYLHDEDPGKAIHYAIVELERLRKMRFSQILRDIGW